MLRKLLIATLALQSTATFAGPVLPTDKRFPAAQRHIEDAIKRKLKDPDSARIKPAYICEWSDKMKAAVVSVNSKNSFGGYTGFTNVTFLELPDGLYITFSSTASDDPSELSRQIASAKMARNCLDSWATAARAAGVAVK